MFVGNAKVLFQLLLAALSLCQVHSQTWDGLPGCRTTKLELVFLVDGSSSVSNEDFNLAKQWIHNMTLSFDISPSSTRVAVIQYSSYPRTEFSLDDYSNSEEIMRAIDNIQYMSGNTQTGMALRYAIERVFVNARDGAAKVAIVLSDGQSQDEVTNAANSLQKKGIVTFAIGIGDMNSEKRVAELREITNYEANNDKLFMVKDFRSISQVQSSLVESVCEQTVHECPTVKHDLCFVIDASSTIGYRDFMKVKEWMKKIINAFDIGPDETRVAIIQYSTTIQEEINFASHYTKQQVLDGVDNMAYMMGDTHTGEALTYMLDVIYTEQYGDRADVPDLAIVMTDGKAQEGNLVIEASQRVHDAGITVYSVGVADYSLDEIKVIATDPDEKHVIEALNYDLIELKRVGLVKSICEESSDTCPTAEAELVFLIDGSSSIGYDNFEKMKTWVKSTVDAFQVGPYYTRVAVVQFTESPRLEFGLGEYSTTQATLRAIQNIRYHRGSTNAGRAVEFTMERVLSETRPGAPRVLIVITDGESQDDVAAETARAREVGVHTLVFGVGGAAPSQLRGMVSSEDYMFHASGFDTIQRLQNKLVSLICVEAEEECPRQEIDLHILVDGSGSIGESNFEKIKTWTKDIVNSFDIGEYGTRVALTQYTSTIHSEFDLKRYSTKQEIQHAIDQIRYLGGSTRTAQALDFIRNDGFSEEAGGRDGAPKVLIIITDGRSNDGIAFSAKALKDTGVNVFVIGNGNMWTSALEVIGSKPMDTHVQLANNYDAINQFRRNLVGEICKETRPECAEAEMDLIFLIDGSSSIGYSQFEITKEWIVSFVNEFEIGEYNAKIGVVQYSSEVTSEIDIGAYENREELVNAILRIQFATGNTNTGSALDFIRRVGFSTRNGARRDVPKVLIVLTDGAARDEVTRAALELHKEGVDVYAIGVGRSSPSQLNTVRSKPHSSTVYHVRNHNSIQTIQSRLLRSVCMQVEPDCANTETDLMFLVDGSTSVGTNNWNIVKSFMWNITEKFDLSTDAVRIGVIQYSTEPRTEIQMGEYRNNDNFQNALYNLNWKLGDTFTAKALQYVPRSYEQSSAREVSKVLIVVTDGRPQDASQVKDAVQALHNQGWRIFAIGVGKVQLTELGALASDPDSDHVFHADDFNSTRIFKGRLTRLICDENSRVTEEPYGERELLTNLNTQLSNLAAQAGRQTSFISRNNAVSPRRQTPKPNLLSQRVQPIRIRSTQASATSRLPPKTLDLEAQSNASICPDFRRDGKRIKGVDILEGVGLRSHSGAVSRISAKSRPGTSGHLRSFRLKQEIVPSVKLQSIFPDGLPRDFSLVMVFRMHGKAIKNMWTIAHIVSDSKKTLLSISFKGTEKAIIVSRASKNPNMEVETMSLRGPLVSTIFNHDFHKMELIFEGNAVTAILDCEQAANRLVFSSPYLPADQSGATFVFMSSQKSTTSVDVQDFIVKCSVDDVAEECCELPGERCSVTQPKVFEINDSTCGCPPEFKSPEVRQAETVEITMLATQIANQLVDEKLAEFREELESNGANFKSTTTTNLE